MKVKILCRNPNDFLRETKRDIHKVPRNYDPALHPFEDAREYSRALNATKLERVFAKPFLGSLDGHRDGVTCMCKHPRSLSTLLSGAYDGEVRIWSLPTRKCVQTLNAHSGITSGICFNPSASHFYTCSGDKTVKLWSLSEEGTTNTQPASIYLGKNVFTSIDHHGKDNIFSTAGETVDIWDEDRTEPIRSFSWGLDTIHHVKFNPVETHLLGSCSTDRSIVLYDMRGRAPLRKIILTMKSNALAWNPMEAFIFTVASDDYNSYTFDMRNLSVPVALHEGHVLAVMDVDYSPTGKEIVTGSYDKTIRIFPVLNKLSREVYHTKRMQRVHTVKWSLDDRYIISGSDEMNLRVWKSRASEKLGALKQREKTAFKYNEKLKEKYSHHPHIKRISKHRHIPKSIYAARNELGIIKESQIRKEKNRRDHSKPGSIPKRREKEKRVVREET